MTTGFTRLLRRYRRADSGITALEFGLVAAPFIWVLCVVFETGLMLFAEYIIENGTIQAGRLIRTGQVQSQGISQGRFRELGIDLPPSRNGDQLSPEVTTQAQFQPGNPLEVVVVRVFYDWRLFTPGITLLAYLAKDRRVLTAATAFRNEPFPK